MGTQRRCARTGTSLPSRRSFLKGIAALGGLALVGPLCLLEDKPKTVAVATMQPLEVSGYQIRALLDRQVPPLAVDRVATALGVPGLEAVGFAPNQATSPAALADQAMSSWTDDFDKRLLERFRANIILSELRFDDRRIMGGWQ